jgi:hypothetical protein
MNDSILKDCRKAVNQAKYSATAERKANALRLLAKLTKAVTNLEEVKPQPKAKKTSKKSKTKAVADKAFEERKKAISSAKLAKLTKAELVAMLSA